MTAFRKRDGTLMKIAPLEECRAYKSQTSNWFHAFITYAINDRAICVVYGDTKEECEERTKVVHAALKAHYE